MCPQGYRGFESHPVRWSYGLSVNDPEGPFGHRFGQIAATTIPEGHVPMAHPEVVTGFYDVYLNTARHFVNEAGTMRDTRPVTRLRP